LRKIAGLFSILAPVFYTKNMFKPAAHSRH
jgi:hypothetical protein